VPGWLADYRPNWIAFVTSDGAEVIVQPDGLGSTRATQEKMSVAGHAPGDTILVTSPTGTGAIQTAVYKPATQNQFNSLLAQWQQELRTQYAAAPCIIGVQGYDANFTFTGAGAQTWCARLLKSTAYQYIRLAGPSGKMDLVCTVQLDGAVAVALDTGRRAVATDVCNQLGNIVAAAPNADWDTVQAAANAQNKTITGLAEQLGQAIGVMRDQTVALKAAAGQAKSALQDEPATLKLLQQHLALEKKDASTQPMTCYLLSNNVSYDYNTTLHYDYSTTLTYQRTHFGMAADAAAKAEAAGTAAAQQAASSADALQRAVSSATYPVPSLKSKPGDEQPLIDAFNASVQAAHADLDPLKVADANVKQQADAIMQDGQGVLESAKTAAGHC
jgi:hypothetical protein